MSSKPTIVQLEYIVAVDNYRHFATAAEKCFVTQPTLSMQIQKLEDHMGISVFDRSKQPVVPTEAGKRILQQARKVLHEAYMIKDIISEELGEVRGELRIGIIPTIAPYLLPSFIRSFTGKYAEVHVHIEELVTDQIVEKLRKELLDVGILVTPLNDKNINETVLFYEKFMGYVSSDSGMVKNQKIDIDQLKNEKIWILNEGHCFREQVVNLCEIQSDSGSDSDKDFSYESGSLEAIKRLVDVYGGVTLLPELAETGLSETDSQKIRVFKDPVPTREVSLVTHRNNLKQNIIKALRKEILAGIPEKLKRRKSNNRVNWR